jgi:hypothetical protein
MVYVSTILMNQYVMDIFTYKGTLAYLLYSGNFTSVFLITNFLFIHIWGLFVLLIWQWYLLMFSFSLPIDIKDHYENTRLIAPRQKFPWNNVRNLMLNPRKNGVSTLVCKTTHLNDTSLLNLSCTQFTRLNLSGALQSKAKR